MKNLKDSSHEFALYYSNTSNIGNSNLKNYKLTDKDLTHRIVKVLRLNVEDSLILFCERYNIKVIISDISSKKSLNLKIINISKNKELQPVISYALPVLKKQAFEDSIYSLVELGVQAIQPLYTSLTQDKWLKKSLDKEYIRLNKIIIAACEQAKQFNIPELKPVLTLEDWLKSIESNKLYNKENLIFFDPSGKETFSIVKELINKNVSSLTLLSGPEADLSLEEKELLLNYNFQFCALTPTVLRAYQAVTIGLGIMRSFLL